MMKKRLIAMGLITVLTLSGCSNSANADTTDQTESSAEEDIAGEGTHATVSTVQLTEGKYSGEKLDEAFDSEDPVITLNGDSVQADADGVTADGTTVTITAEGTYVLTGELQDGQIIVNAANKGNVKLVLNQASITCKDSAPVYVKEGKVVITLVGDTSNYIEDARTETEDSESSTDIPNAAIYSKDDLSFNGTGTLEVKADFKNGIQSKDDLKFVSGIYKITAENHGIVGKDSVSVKDGEFNITSSGDGIQATNIEESDKGYVMIDGGTFTIDSSGDGIQAETLLRINDGTVNITTNGGSGNASLNQNVPEGDIPMGTGGMMRGGQGGRPGRMQGGSKEQQESADGQIPAEGQTPPEGQMPAEGQTPPEGAEDMDNQQSEEDAVSAKGLKSFVDIMLAGGTYQIDTYDDAIHSNGTVTVDGGIYTMSTGDDGIHADKKLTVNDGEIEVGKSYEGLEAFEITLNGGQVKVYASDDGINAAGDSGQSQETENASNSETGMGIGGPGMNEDQGALFTITGGSLYVNASGDALDANGDIDITGGEVELQGPASGGDGTFDYGGQCRIEGGSLRAVGSSGMAQSVGSNSSQYSISGVLDNSVAAGTVIVVSNAAGKEIISITAEKSAQWYCVSSEELKTGETYKLTAGDQEVTCQAK